MYAALRKLVVQLVNEEVTNRIIVFSDGGPKHFKTRRGLFYMWLISQEVNRPIDWHFFASNHGKCRCDGHFGVCKCWHRRLVKDGLRLDGVDEYVAAQNTYVQNTTAYPMKAVETPTQDVDKFRTIKVRAMHKYQFRYFALSN